MKKKDAQMILDYMEGHDYRLANENGKLVRIDMCDNFSKRFKTRRIVNLVNSCYTDHTPIIYTCFFLL
jgi:hypothetical protein